MALGPIILIIIIIILAVLAFKFLVGAARTVISIGLFIIAAALTMYVLTGYDFMGIGSTIGAAVSNILP